MGHYLVLFVFWAFVAFVIALVIRAIVVTARPEPKPVPPAEHVHEWREVTEFVRQCRHRECSVIQFGPETPPDGMRDYVNLMTTVEARQDPNLAASHYKELDFHAWGPSCPYCQRVIGFPWNLPKDPFTSGPSPNINVCPYCQNGLIFEEGKTWKKV